MTRAMKFTLLAIALFFLATVGSFIWFVATWDPSKEEPIGQVFPTDRTRAEAPA